MSAVLDYYQWLCDRIAISNPKEYGYGQLFARLMMAPFVAYLPEDENRMEDALYLRRTFTRDGDGLGEDEKRVFYQTMGPVSVFEIMVVMVEKMSYDLIGNLLADNNPASLFFELIDNLALGYLNDEAFEADLDTTLDELEGIIETFVERNYKYDGNGGLFPMEIPVGDMTKMDLIQQMELYLTEKYDKNW